MRQRRAVLALLPLLLSAAPSAVSAQATVYTNQSDFRAASGATLRATFESATPGEQAGRTWNEGGIRFHGDAYDLKVIAAGALDNPAGAGSSQVLSATNKVYVAMTFGTSPIGALGFTVYQNSNSSVPTYVGIGFTDGTFQQFTLAQSPNTSGFFGFTSTLGVNVVDFHAVRQPYAGPSTPLPTDAAIDNVYAATFAAPVTTPEPSSLALLATGVVGLVPAIRQRRR